MTNLDGHDCCYCPARRFPSQAALTDHIERACPVYAAERATRPRDPLAVLRDALAWAEDAGAFDVLPDRERDYLYVERLDVGKPIPGYPRSLFAQHPNVSVRVAIAARRGGASLVVHLLYRDGLSVMMRRALPERFALPVERAPVLADSRAMMDRYHEARERGLGSEAAVNPTGPALLEALRSSLNSGREG